LPGILHFFGVLIMGILRFIIGGGKILYSIFHWKSISTWFSTRCR